MAQKNSSAFARGVKPKTHEMTAAILSSNDGFGGHSTLLMVIKYAALIFMLVIAIVMVMLFFR